MPVKLLKFPEYSGLVLKNLGSQLAWATVFYVEYLGPILIYGLCYYLGDRSKYTFLQK